MNEKKDSAAKRSLELTEVYKRPKWKNGIRIFGFVVIVLLNFSMIMSSIKLHMPLQRSIFSYLLLLLFDLIILFPVVFEVHSIEVKPDKLVLKTLFWKVSLAWQDIVEFKCPQYMRFAILRTRRCFYLIKRQDIKGFDHLAQSIASKTDSLTKT